MQRVKDTHDRLEMEARVSGQQAGCRCGAGSAVRFGELPWQQNCHVREHRRDVQEQGLPRVVIGKLLKRKHAPADAEELSGDRTLLLVLAEALQMLWPSHVFTAPCLSFPSCKPL